LGGDPTGAALAVFAFGSVDFGALGAVGVVLGGAPRRLGGAPTGGSGLASLRGAVEGAAFCIPNSNTSEIKIFYFTTQTLKLINHNLSIYIHTAN
jgi:hypothetical protein